MSAAKCAAKGTPRYMARSVAIGQLQPLARFMIFGAMPRLNDPAHRQPDYEVYNHDVGEEQIISKTPAGVSFRHRLFHDAESVLRVLTWLLIRAAPLDNTADDMSRYYTMACFPFFLEYSGDPKPHEWASALHPGLSSIRGMLADMHWYMDPEWAYRTDVKREDHALEAMMRLLLVEIVRMKESEEHIPLHSELRNLPLSVKAMLEASTSTSTSEASSNQRGSGQRSAITSQNKGYSATRSASTGTHQSDRLTQLADNLTTTVIRPHSLSEDQKREAGDFLRNNLADELQPSVTV
jgi:hypothetical protein